MANSAPSELTALPRWRQKLADGLKAAMEALVLAMVFLSPWAFGAVDPRWELWLYVGVAVLMTFWAARLLVEFRFTWKPCPVAFCLTGLLLLAIWQLAPLPRDMLTLVSPQTTQIYDRVLPAQPETLPDFLHVSAGSAGSTISVFPHATRHAAVRLLAVLLVFLVVRNVIATRASLWRLSVASVLVGAALALLGVIQFFTSPPTVIYWSVQTEGSVFGPFVCRNHFPYYANLCFGLGGGLLLSRITAEPRRHGTGKQEISTAPSQRAFSLTGLLQEPQDLWIALALILIAAGVVFSASRGGLLAFVGGGVFSLTLVFRRSAKFIHLEAGVLILGGSIALLTWFGLERVQARLGTLLDADALQDGRVALLYRVPPLIRDFPIWGTGYGSLDYVEPMYRNDATDAGWAYQHAHNEYLEALIEGGAVRLGLSLLAIGFVFRVGFRAVRRHEGQPAGGLVIGSLFGFTTLVLHSFVDFGIHIPAIAVFAAVICAHLAALGEADGHTPPDDRVPAPRAGASVAARGLLTLLAAATLVSLGLFLLAEAWRAAEVRRLSRTAWALRGSTDPADQLSRLTLSEAAARVDPGDARIQFDAGERHAAIFESLRRRQFAEEGILDAIQAVLLLNPSNAPAAGTTSISTLLIMKRLHQERRRRVVTELERRHVAPALAYFIQARNLSPTRAKTHMEIATYVTSVQKADSRRTYIRRTLLLDPMNPEFWYRAGALEVGDGQVDQGCEDWRRSLELSDVFLKKILERGQSRMNPQQVLDRILPEQPRILVAAADMIYPDPRAPERRIILEKARGLMDQFPGPWEADDVRLKGLVLASLGHPEVALAAYREALLRKPQQSDWRFELAQLLFEQERFQQARQELHAILSLQPRHDAARQLLGRVEREIAKGRG